MQFAEVVALVGRGRVVSVLPMVSALVLAGASGAGAGVTEQVVDGFDCSDAAVAREVWKSGVKGVEVEVQAEKGRGMALKIPLPFKGTDISRVYVDRKVDLDLTPWSEVALDVFVPDHCPAAQTTLFLRSGGGWFGQSFDMRKGWNTVRLRKDDFKKEGKPAGWGRIDGIRISPWKHAAADGYCLVDKLCLRAAHIAVVAAKVPQRRDAVFVTKLLRDAKLDVDLIPEAEVARGALKHAKVALLPNNPDLLEGEEPALRKFIDRDGKIMVFYQLRNAVADLLGIKGTGWVRRNRRCEFSKIVFSESGIEGLPGSVEQLSWNITLAEPVAKNARVIARWFDCEGEDTGRVAVIMSDTGFFMSHVVLGDDIEGKKRMLLSWLGHCIPEIWPEAARRAIDAAGRVGPANGMDELAAFIMDKRHAQCPSGDKALASLKAAQELLVQAESLFCGGKFADAVDAAKQAKQKADSAYAFCHSPRDCEFRAMWNHSGTGAYPGDWERSILELKKAGFNAIVPNMWWAGRAHYDSALLPHSETFKKFGDQIAQCVAAAKKNGIEVHPWKVNWNLSGAPKEFIEKMRAEGRLQADPEGKEILWLCPSHPKNFELELASMVEVARNYDVDGIHFDYIRYPNRKGCYCEGCRKRFEEKLGRKVENWPADVYDGPLAAAYTDFRCEQISRLVKATSEQVRKIKPQCKISAAVFNSYPGCRDSVGQDWVLWCKKGWLDFVCPMNYIRDDSAFAERVAEQVELVGGSVPLYSGVGVLLRWRKSPEETIRQIELARDAGADGVILFNYSDKLPADFMEKLGCGIFSKPATLPHNKPEK